MFLDDYSMLHLSLAAKESIKTGLAMALACGFAMAMGWDNPYWACIAVAVVSLPVVGESLKKCLQRLWGTVIAGAVALTVLGLFPQERWPFFACMSLYLGLCAYKITTSRFVYFWFLSGYVSLLIAAAIIGTSAQHAFATAVLRLQETGLGILVYAMVSLFIWPQRGSHDLDATVKSLLDVLAKILHLSFSQMRGDAQEEPAEKWLRLGDQLVGQLHRRLDASEMERFQPRERRARWRKLAGAFAAMLSSLRLWRESFPELRQVAALPLEPGPQALRNAFLARLSRLQTVMEGGKITGEPAVPLRLETQRLAALPHLQRAAVQTTFAALKQVETASRTMADCLLTIKGRQPDAPMPVVSVSPPVPRHPDADSFIALFRGVAAVWLAAVIWIAIDPPGHLAFVVFVGLFTLMGVMIPQMQWLKFLIVNLIGVVIATGLYVFVMPRLARYTELSLLIFCLISFISYISWHPRLTSLKLAGVVPFIMMTNIQNHQTYDFASFVNNAAAMVSGILCAALLFRFPFSSRPETMFLRVMGRFFHQAETVLAGTNRPTDRQKALAAMQHSIGKLGGWANSVNYARLPDDMRQKVADLVTGLNAIACGFMVLQKCTNGDRPATAPPALDFRNWDDTIRTTLHAWATETPDSHLAAGGYDRLAATYRSLDHEIEAAFEQASSRMSEKESASWYRLLGGYRGIHRALLQHAATLADFDWAVWKEPRY